MSAQSPVAVDIRDADSLAAALRQPSSGWKVHFDLRTSAALSSSDDQWDACVVSPLLFAAEVARAALTSGSRPRSLVLVLTAREWPGLAEVALAALRWFCRSLAVELEEDTTVVGISGDAPPAAQELPCVLPSGTWIDFRPHSPLKVRAAAPLPSPAPPQVVVVTGGGDGIGKAIARRFARAGAAVIVVDRNENAALDVARVIRSGGGRAESVAGDVSELATLEQALGAASHFGKLTTWINNAGVCRRCYIRDLAANELRSTIAVNLQPALRSAQLLSKSGSAASIVNVSSTAARSAGMVAPGRYNAYAAYAATKAGLDALTRVTAREAAAQAIRVNAVAPGPVLTDLVTRLYSDAERRSLEQQVPLGRFATPEEVADAVAFLASSSCLTGQVLAVDGGMGAIWLA